MGELPYIKFYLDDWIGGTYLLDRRHKGAYLDLLIAQVKTGHMDDHMVIEILGVDGDCWPRLKEKFSLDNEGKFYNRKMEDVVLQGVAYCESRRRNLSKTIHMKRHMADHMGDHMGAHSGSGSGSCIQEGECEGEGEAARKPIITTIANVPIPWSMYGKVLKKYGDDHRRAQIAFYRGAKSAEPLTSEAAWWRWLQAGFNRERQPGGWLYEPCQDETDNRGEIQRWIDQHFPIVQVPVGKGARQTKRLPESIRDILPGIAGSTEGGDRE